MISDRLLEAVWKRHRHDRSRAGWPGRTVILIRGCDTLDEHLDVDPDHPRAT
jgi:hypothetical protein